MSDLNERDESCPTHDEPDAPTWFTRVFPWFPQLDRDDRRELYTTIEAGARWDADFIVMMALSSALASLGLMQGSTAVVIGAMLVAPLMGPLLAGSDQQKRKTQDQAGDRDGAHVFILLSHPTFCLSVCCRNQADHGILPVVWGPIQAVSGMKSFNLARMPSLWACPRA